MWALGVILFILLGASLIHCNEVGSGSGEAASGSDGVDECNVCSDLCTSGNSAGAVQDNLEQGFALFVNDGECQDGGPGAELTNCDYGTDCSDCGPRCPLPPSPPVAPPSPALPPLPPLSPSLPPA